jgi:hypothetical protein
VKLHTLLLAAVAAILVAATPATAPVPTGSISGTVTLSGRPAAGIVVWLDVPVSVGGHANYTSYTTGTNGAYSFHYLPAATFTVHAVVPAGDTATPATVKESLQVGQQVAGANFALTPAGAPAAVVLPPPISPLPGLSCGTGTPTTAPAVYALPPTGVAWLDVSRIAPTRTTRRLWHTQAGYAAAPNPKYTADPVKYAASPTIDLNNCLSAQSIPVIYDVAGTYTATVDVTPVSQVGVPTGPAVTYGQTIVRPVDARPVYFFASNGNDADAGTQAAPMLSYAKLAALAVKGNVRCVIIAPYDFAWAGTVSVGSHTTIEGLPTAAGVLPVVDFGATPTCAFQPWTTATDVLIRRLRFTSAGTVANGVTTAPTGPNGGRAQALASYGNGVLIDQCEFGVLVRAVEQDLGDGCGVTRCVQLDPLSINGQVVSTWGGARLVVYGCTLTGGFGEAVVRIDGSGTEDAVDSSLVEQSNPTATATSGKAAVDVRASAGGGVAVVNDAIVGAQESYTTGHGANSCGNVLSTGNVHRPVQGSPGTSITTIRGGVVGITVAGNDYAGAFTTGTAAAWVESDASGMSDIVVGANITAAGVLPYYVYGAAPPGLVTVGATTQPAGN